MSLAAGSKLGPYEIVTPIGAGGMGEVYRAHDPRMGRDVAIKVSTERFSDRFSREVHAVAALNHPNICTVHDVGSDYLVMELVEGPTLAERVKQGAVPLEESIQIARQIADALEAAHEKGIVHRDLKPGNIKIKPDGTVKVLDFGLAKIGSTPTAQSEDSPTVTVGVTETGIILGTAAYMAPEQARGQVVDKRADIWAFGVVLYEMVTGKRLFGGDTMSDTLAAVLEREPQWDRVPAKVQRLLKKCLEKNPKRRLRDIGDAWELLEETSQTESPLHQERLRPWLAWAVAAIVFAIALAAVSLVHFREKPPVEAPLRFSIPLGDKSAVFFLALSPDGRTVAIAGGNKDGLWLRPLDSLELRSLPNTDGAEGPFWSPDGRSLGYFADFKLKIMAVTGGLATSLCDVAGFGGTWNREGVILFGAAEDGPIQRANAAGGVCTPVTQAEPGVSHRLPTFLPDGKHFLYLVLSRDQSKAGLYLAALDLPGGAGRRLLPDHSSAIFVPRRKSGGHDHLLFQRENKLMAQPFDAETLQLAGEPFPVAPQLSRTPAPNQVAASAAGNGTLVYLAGSSRTETQTTWLDRSGKELGKVGPLGNQPSFALSPDQKSVALAYQNSSRSGIWLHELARDVETRLTLPPLAAAPVWSPDSGRIAFSGPDALYVKNVGGGPEQLMLQRDRPIYASDWSRDGKHLLYTDDDPKTLGDIWSLPLDPSGKPGEPVAFLKTEFNESQGQFSPDGHWIAYVSNESGQEAVYVRPFSSGGAPTRISSSGGINPRWRADGKELYYLTEGDPESLMAVSVQSRPGGFFQAGVPTALFEVHTRIIVAQANSFSYSPSLDGQRFLMVVVPDTAPPTLNVITNWEKAATGTAKEP